MSWCFLLVTVTITDHWVKCHLTFLSESKLLLEMIFQLIITCSCCKCDWTTSWFEAFKYCRKSDFSKSLDFLQNVWSFQKVMTFYKKSGLFIKSLDFWCCPVTFWGPFLSCFWYTQLYQHFKSLYFPKKSADILKIKSSLLKNQYFWVNSTNFFITNDFKKNQHFL